MRNLIFIVFLVIAVGKPGTAQNWAPAGAKWYYNFWVMGCCSGYYQITHISDSLVGGKYCSVLENTKYSYDYNIQQLNVSNQGNEYMYEDSGRVYHYKWGSFHLLYDFNLQAGDSMQFVWERNAFQCDSFGLMRVDSAGTVVINMDTLKFQDVSVYDDYYLVWNSAARIIERIGSLEFMFFYRYSCSNLIVDGEILNPLRCYYDSSFGLYNNAFVHSCDYIPTSVNEYNLSNSITLSPNPATNYLSVQSSVLKIESWEVINILGEVIRRQTLNKEQVTFNVDVSSFPAGVYYLKISSEGNSAVKKFIKM